VLEVRRRLGEFTSDLVDVFLVALLDFLAEYLLQRPVAESFLALLRQVRDHVRHERAREPLGLRVRIVREKRIERTLRRCGSRWRPGNGRRLRNRGGRDDRRWRGRRWNSGDRRRGRRRTNRRWRR